MRVVFTGSHSTGKTSLIKLLASLLDTKFAVDYCLVNEVARTILRRGYKLHKESTISTYLALINEHVEQEIASINRTCLIDRFLVDYYAYAVVNDNCPNELLQLFRNSHTLVSRTIGYDYVFYCPIEFDLVLDGERWNNVDYQKEVDVVIKKTLDEWNVEYVTLTGSLDKRINTILDIVLKRSTRG